MNPQATQPKEQSLNHTWAFSCNTILTSYTLLGICQITHIKWEPYLVIFYSKSWEDAKWKWKTKKFRIWGLTKEWRWGRGSRSRNCASCYKYPWANMTREIWFWPCEFMVHFYLPGCPVRMNLIMGRNQQKLKQIYLGHFQCYHLESENMVSAHTQWSP